jgi:hypothetical protein
MQVNVMTFVNHLGYPRRSRKGRALKIDINLEAFLLAERYLTKDGKEWVNMVVPMKKLLDVLEGNAEAAVINQLEHEFVTGGVKEAKDNKGHA